MRRLQHQRPDGRHWMAGNTKRQGPPPPPEMTAGHSCGEERRDHAGKVRCEWLDWPLRLVQRGGAFPRRVGRIPPFELGVVGTWSVPLTANCRDRCHFRVLTPKTRRWKPHCNICFFVRKGGHQAEASGSPICDPARRDSFLAHCHLEGGTGAPVCWIPDLPTQIMWLSANGMGGYGDDGAAQLAPGPM